MALPNKFLVPLVRIVNFMGIHDAVVKLFLPYWMAIWPSLMKQFSENIPTELLESAKIDGCGGLRTSGAFSL